MCDVSLRKVSAATYFIAYMSQKGECVPPVLPLAHFFAPVSLFWFGSQRWAAEILHRHQRHLQTLLPPPPGIQKAVLTHLFAGQ